MRIRKQEADKYVMQGLLGNQVPAPFAPPAYPVMAEILPPSLPNAFSTSTKSFCLPQKQPLPKYIGVVLSPLSVLLLAESALTPAPDAVPVTAAREGLADKLKAKIAATACCVRDCLQNLYCLS